MSTSDAALPRTHYPQALLPHEAAGSETLDRCIHCRKELALKKWDRWNGFLVECPHCHSLHGKRWKFKRVLLASFVFNALSFLFTMRPRRAFPALVGFILFIVVGNYAVDNLQLPDEMVITIASLFLLGPMIINGVVLSLHERDLDNSSS